MKNLVLLLGVVTACGGGDEDYEYVPIVSSSLEGSLRGDAMTFEAGIAMTYSSGAPIFVFGEGNITCETFGGDVRPPGTYAYVVVPGPVGTMLSVQTYEDPGVSLESYEGGSTNIVGTNGGTLTISEITETAVSGSIDFTYVVDGEEVGSLAGAFEVTRCP